MAGHDGFTVTPRRGELIVFDKLSRRLVNHVLLPVPTATTKGVLVAPTVFGNVILGPTAVDVERKDDTGSTAEGIAQLLDAGPAHHAHPARAGDDRRLRRACAPPPSTPTTRSPSTASAPTPAPAASARRG